MLTKIIVLNLFFALVLGDDDESTRIVNGTNAEEGEFPFAVSLRYKSRHTCGGTILNDRFILTAAHCVCSNENPRNSSLYSIQYNMVKISEEPVNAIDVKKINCHQFNSEELVYDCALLELQSPIPEGKWTPVKLSKNFVSEEEKVGTIIGWGRTSHGGPLASHLQKLDVNIYDDNLCGKKFDTKHHICFGSLFGGACNGDSGTALLVDGVQVGIASFITNLCGIANKENPNVYSRVSSYYNWIEKIATL